MTNPEYADFFESTLKHYNNPRVLANWFFTELLSFTGNLQDIHIEPADVAALLKKIDSGEISGKIAKQVIKKSFHFRQGAYTDY